MDSRHQPHAAGSVARNTGWPGAATSPIMLALVAAWFLLAAVVAVPIPGLHA